MTFQFLFLQFIRDFDLALAKVFSFAEGDLTIDVSQPLKQLGMIAMSLRIYFFHALVELRRNKFDGADDVHATCVYCSLHSRLLD